MFGLGKGTISLTVTKESYAVGDTIQGTLTLDLKKPLKAKELNITLLAHQKATQRVGTSYSTSTVCVYEDTVKIAEGGDFAMGTQTYPFKIKIPITPLSGKTVAMGLAAFTKVSSLFGKKNIQWSLVGRLDIPWALDVKKKLKLNIAQE